MDKFLNKKSSSNEHTTKLHQTGSKSNCEENNPSPTSSPASYLFDGSKFFQIVKNENNHLSAKCLKCLKIINGSSSSTGNFLSHISVSKYCIPVNMNQCRLVIVCSNFQRMHPTLMTNIEESRSDKKNLRNPNNDQQVGLKKFLVHTPIDETKVNYFARTVSIKMIQENFSG